MMKIEDFYKLYAESDGVSIDSRTILPNQIFFAIKGENFDGHDYVSQLVKEGRHLAVIDDPKYKVNDQTILIENTLEYLQDLARYHRQQYDIPVLAITGSNGKTTTKELLAACLSNKFNLHATRGNYNNHLGVPLTLLEAQADVDFMIIEMGANHIGEIRELCKIALPTHGLITNIGKAHIEGFGSVEGIIKGKTELYDFLRNNGGTIFYNRDDGILSGKILDTDNTISYASSTLSVVEEGLTISFSLDSGQHINTHLYGSYNLTNIAAVLSVASFFGVEESLTLDSISKYKPEMNRSQILVKGSTTFIMDAYNANPSSMKSSIDAMIEMQDGQAKGLILGDMKELGADGKAYHQEIINLIKEKNWHFVALVGPLFTAADTNNMFVHFKDIDALLSYTPLKDTLRNTTCLIKGSRSMRLEKLTALF